MTKISSAEGRREQILQMTPGDVYHEVNRIWSPTDLRMIAHTRFGAQARMYNEDNAEPFIYWGPMNQELELWVPLLLGKITQMELKAKRKWPDVIIAAPSSATPYADEIRNRKIFGRHINYPFVVRASKIKELGLENEPHEIIPVHSYVHDRHSTTGEHISPDIAVFTPELINGSKVLLLDDVIAETVTLHEMATGLKKMGAIEVYAAAVMSKDVQGGLPKLQGSPSIDMATALINVRQTNGSKGEIIFQ